MPHCRRVPTSRHAQPQARSRSRRYESRRATASILLHLFTIDRPALRYTCAILLTATSSTVQTANRYVTVFYFRSNATTVTGSGLDRGRTSSPFSVVENSIVEIVENATENGGVRGRRVPLLASGVWALVDSFVTEINFLNLKQKQPSGRCYLYVIWIFSHGLGTRSANMYKRKL